MRFCEARERPGLPITIGAMDDLAALQSLGLELPSPAYIVGAIIFGLVGWVAFRYGRKQKKPRTLWLGVALMLYPYAISRTWMLYAVGVALCAGLVLDRS
ncbi:MFS family permease [Variovorax sp. GrIS 2.14]